MAVPAMTPTLVVAGSSARLMAEAARRDGFGAIALDCFGDADTQRACARWQRIGTAAPGAPRIDGRALVDALRQAAAEPGVIGWIAGSDLECRPELLERGTACLPLLGTAPQAVRRVREPATFFAMLDALGLPCPETRMDEVSPRSARGWLCKHARSAGGWHVRPAHVEGVAEPARQPYWQRELGGRPMSALFVADGRSARLLGCHELIVRPLGASHPYVYRGAIGPLPIDTVRDARLQAMAQALAKAFALRGLASLDFIEDDAGKPWLLEVNPRPSASMGLHGAGLMRAHVEACLHGRLPLWAPAHTGPLLGGNEIVFARRAFALSDAAAQALHARTDCHDIPNGAGSYAAGDPVLTVSAQGRTVQDVRDALAAKRRALRDAFAAVCDAGSAEGASSAHAPAPTLGPNPPLSTQESLPR